MADYPVICIVDDDASVRLAMGNLLGSLGYIVHTFASAEKFLQSSLLNDTSCVIADVQMPAMNGLELHAHLLAQGNRLPFIFITAFPDETARRRAMENGAVCFLIKPFDRAGLMICLENALKRYGDKIE